MKSILIGSTIYFTQFIYFLIFVRVIISWLPVRDNNVIIKLVYSLTEPILAPIRKLIYKSPLGGSGLMIDFSPIIAWILIELIKRILISLL